MTFKKIAVALLVLVSIILPIIAHAEPEKPDGSFSFSGEVRENGSFTHELPGGLYFHLYPTKTGWVISVNPVEDQQSGVPESDLAGITRPLHGPNPTQIDLDDLNGENAKKGVVPIYGEVRDFEFALNAKDRTLIFEEYKVRSAPGPVAASIMVPSRRGFGTLTIEEVNPGANKTLFEGGLLGAALVPPHIRFTVSGNIGPARQTKD